MEWLETEHISIIKCEKCGCPIGRCREKGCSSVDEYNDDYSGKDLLCSLCSDSE